MILYPPCKINLGLHILNKRNDGYHELDTCMYEIPLNDILEIVPAEEFQFTSSGLEIPGDINKNLCVKAFQLIKEKHNIGNVKIHLHKQIPMGGGLGGGSSDATFTLKILNKIFNLCISDTLLTEYAAILGSDCAFFVQSNCQIAKGRGEILKPISLNLKGYFIKIINIGIHISTAEAFSNIEFNYTNSNVEQILFNGIENWKNELNNDFEKSIFIKYPILLKIKEELYKEGAIYASMTGSGSTMYAIYKDEPSNKTFDNLNPLYEIVIKI